MTGTARSDPARPPAPLVPGVATDAASDDDHASAHHRSPLPTDRLRSWLVTAGVAGVAAAARLPALDRPRELVFDETYYVKDAWTWLHLGYEAEWPEDPDPAFEAGEVDGYLDRGAFVVHPPVGKALIALGLRLLGAQDPVGWRLASAVAGIIAVVVLTRVARRLFRSTALGAAAGLLLAIDGAAIVHSRTALLDGFLMLLVLGAFAALVADRDAAVRRVMTRSRPPRAPERWGPLIGMRPWRILAGVLLGLALGVKWSAVWFVVVLGLLTVGWDAAARRRAGIRQWWQGSLLRDAGPAFVALVPVAALTYLAAWVPWLRSTEGYGRDWAATHPDAGVQWLPEGLRSLWHYHGDMWRFHTTVTSDHPYAAHPVGWVVQVRPTVFFHDAPEPAQQQCAADRCAQAITSLGNPLLWWLGALALVACLWWVLRWRDGVAVAALSGVVAGWLPWFAYTHRTIFTFYAIVFLPWLILCLTWAAARLLRWGEAHDRWRLGVRAVVAALALVVVATSVFFWPVWTGEVVTLRFWQLHQWWSTWI